MPFTIHKHTSLPLNQNWHKVKSDKSGFRKFEEKNTPATSQIKKKILTLSIFTFGFFYLYMKCSKNGRLDLNNLKNGRIIHYIQKDNTTKSQAKSSTQKTVNSFNQTVPLNRSPKGKAALDELLAFINRSESQSVVYDFSWIKEKAKIIIETCPFDSSSQSVKDYEKIYSLLGRFSDFESLKGQLKNRYIQMGLELPIPKFYTRNALDAEIVTVQRDSITLQDGKTLPQDPSPVECLVLKGINGKMFGVKIVPPEGHDFVVIVAQKNGQPKEICVKKEDFAERLYLDPLEVSVNGNGELAKCLAKEKTVAVLSNYERILRKQSKFEAAALQPQDLIKVVKAAFRDSSSKDKDLPIGHLMKPDYRDDKDFKALLEKRKIVCSFRGDKLFLSDITNQQSIASGGEAEILKIQPLSSQKVRIMKVFEEFISFTSLPASKARPEAGLVQTLHQSHPLGKVPGIQKPFYGVTAMGVSKSAILMTEYDGNLLEALGFTVVDDQDSDVPLKESIFTSMEEKLLAFYQPLQGFQYCVSKKGLIHQDIKLRNFLYLKNRKTKKIEIYLSDFGSASLLDLNKQTQNDYERPWTPKYVLFQDKEAKIELGKSIYRTANLEKWQEYVQLCRSWDIFSLGIILSDLLAPGKDWMDIPRHPKPGTFKKQVLIDAGVPEKLASLIESMVQTEWKKRPTIDQVLATYEAVLKEKGLN